MVQLYFSPSPRSGQICYFLLQESMLELSQFSSVWIWIIFCCFYFFIRKACKLNVLFDFQTVWLRGQRKPSKFFSEQRYVRSCWGYRYSPPPFTHTPFSPPPPHSHTLEYQSIARLPSSPLVSCQVCLTVAGSHDDSERWEVSWK